MNNITVPELVILAQQGDEHAREKLIILCKSFIQNTSNGICQRQLNWENNDELSVALIAFDEAIGAYDPGRGSSFLTFARRVINQRLVDYFRKESRHQHLSLVPVEEDREFSTMEKAKSEEDHQRKIEQEDLAEMMLEFDGRLTEYGISLEELAENSPRHKDTRERLLGVATILCNDERLLSSFRQKKRLPSTDLARKAKVSQRVLENGRKYIIALVLIMSESNFRAMKSFIDLD